MLAIAARHTTGEHASTLKYVLGEASGLPVSAGSFDAVTATQVYEYVPDMTTALAEARRVLRPGGGC